MRYVYWFSGSLAGLYIGLGRATLDLHPIVAICVGVFSFGVALAIETAARQ